MECRDRHGNYEPATGVVLREGGRGGSPRANRAALVSADKAPAETAAAAKKAKMVVNFIFFQALNESEKRNGQDNLG